MRTKNGGRALVALAWIASAVMAAACAPLSSGGAVPSPGVSTLDRLQAGAPLRVCLTGDYKPFGFLRADGEFEGIDVDLARSLAASLKTTPRFVKTSWSTLMTDFGAGACDIAMGGISITLDRQAKAAFSTATMVDGKMPIVRCADLARFATPERIDQPGVRAIVNPGGTNERFARATFRQAQIRVYPDNVTIFDELVAGRADVMVTDASETLLQHKLRPTLCPVPLERPLQFSEKAFLLPRDDAAWKAYVDQWLHLSKATGEFDAVSDRWLK